MSSNSFCGINAKYLEICCPPQKSVSETEPLSPAVQIYFLFFGPNVCMTVTLSTSLFSGAPARLLANPAGLICVCGESVWEWWARMATETGRPSFPNGKSQSGEPPVTPINGGIIQEKRDSIFYWPGVSLRRQDRRFNKSVTLLSSHPRTSLLFPPAALHILIFSVLR